MWDKPVTIEITDHHKRALFHDRAGIDAEFERLSGALERGRMLLGVDHPVPPEGNASFWLRLLWDDGVRSARGFQAISLSSTSRPPSSRLWMPAMTIFMSSTVSLKGNGGMPVRR